MAPRQTIVAGGNAAERRRADSCAPSAPVADLRRLHDELDRAAHDVATSALVGSDPAVDVAESIAAAAERLGVAAADLAHAVLDRALADARLFEVAPALAVRAQLGILASAPGVVEASVWAASLPGSVTRLGSSSDGAASRRLVALARRTIEDDTVIVTGVRSPILGIPVRRNGVAHGALAIQLQDVARRDAVELLGQAAASRLSLMLERRLVLEHGETGARNVAETTERRLVRTAYDLHDGPLQALAVLAEELRLVTSDVVALVPESCRAAVAEALASVQEQAVGAEEEIREIARSLETSAVARRPIEELLQREAAGLARRSGIEVVTDVRAELDGLSDSQRIVLYRGVQEALANVARHSGAATATIRVRSQAGGVTLTVSDDGQGFDSARVLPEAARRGRLGLVGIAERARLLGGFVVVQSVRGEGTAVKIVLPAWSPLDAATGGGHSS
jgi:two-component system, NarL family, sensor histidine kinase UhpB